MSAQFPRIGARLPTLLPRLLARPRVADSDALVSAARYRLVARQTARNFANVAGYGFSKLVLAVAPSLGENGAGRAGGFAVAIVQHFVAAIVLTRARPLAGGPPGAAGNGRIYHRGSAFAVQLFEAAAPTSLTSSFVTALLALMPTAA